MRRLCLLAALLILPAAAHAATRPTDGCPVPCSGQISSPADNRLLFIQPAGVPGPVAAYDTATGALRFLLPAGITAADGRLHYAAHIGRVGTVVSRHAVRSGALEDSFLVDGRWRIAGVSPTGMYVALSRRAADRSRTWIEIHGASGTRVHSLELRGDFEVDTVSRDGARLFLIEHLHADGSPRYAVRLFDLTHEHLTSAPLRGKGEPPVMAGLAWSGIGSPDGRWLLTLYLNTSRSVAFVHALDLVRSSPLCIFLPTGDSFAELKSYGLTLSPDGKKLYAANAELGAVAEIDLATRKVVRTVRFAGRKSPAGALSMSGTISRNGRTLYFSGGRDLYAYDAAYGVVRGPYRTDGAIQGFGFGVGDKRVHALRADGRMLTFDAATGRRVR
jgi:YVTN family beta-propeller protein